MTEALITMPLATPVMDKEKNVSGEWRNFLQKTKGVGGDQLMNTPMVDDKGLITDLWREHLSNLNGHMPISHRVVDDNGIINTVWRRYLVAG